MADETGANGAGDQGTGGNDQLPQVAVLVQYVKDYSFENPNSPAVYQWQGQPQTDVQFNVGSQSVGEDIHEVAIKVDITSTTSEGTAFKLDLLYAGLIALRNVPKEQTDVILYAEAPRILFPFVRKIISDATVEAGQASQVFQCRINKDGAIGNINASDAADAHAFAALLKYVERRIAELADDLIAGVIAVRPYRMATTSPSQSV